MKRLTFVFILICPLFAFSQDTYDWINTAPDGNFKQGASGGRWSKNAGASTYWDEPGFGILYFGNNTYTSMTNNATSFSTHRIFFTASATSARTISGNAIRLYDYSGNDPIISNNSSATHIFSCAIDGDGDAGDPLQLNPIAGDMDFQGAINNQGSDIHIYGSAGHTVQISGGVSGSGGIEVKQNSILDLAYASSFTGDVDVSDGDLIINATMAFTTLNLIDGYIENKGTNILDDAIDITVTDGEIRFRGDETIDNLTMNGGTLTIDAGITLRINGTLTLNSGVIDIADGNIVMSNTGSISGYSSTNYIATTGTGTLTIDGIGSTAEWFPVGPATANYTPMSVANSGTVDDFTIGVFSGVTVDGTSTGTAITTKSVDVTWNVSEETTGGSDVTLTAQWNGSNEQTSFDRSSCYIAHYTGGSWDPTSGGSASGSGPYTISRSGITSFSPFGVGFGGTLPIELLGFTAKLDDFNNVKLNWSTSSEINNAGFTILRFTEGNTNEVIDFVEGAGNADQINRYETIDLDVKEGTYFYSLKQTDFDGNVTVFGPKKVVIAPTNPISISEVDNGIRISWGLTEVNAIQVATIEGKIIVNKDVTGENTSFSRNDLAPGIYLITIESPGGTITKKIQL